MKCRTDACIVLATIDLGFDLLGIKYYQLLYTKCCIIIDSVSKTPLAATNSVECRCDIQIDTRRTPEIFLHMRYEQASSFLVIIVIIQNLIFKLFLYFEVIFTYLDLPGVRKVVANISKTEAVRNFCLGWILHCSRLTLSNAIATSKKGHIMSKLQRQKRFSCFL